MWLVFCKNTKENFWWEPEKKNDKFHKITSYTWNFQNFTCLFTILVKFDIHFLGLPWQIFVVIYYRRLITSLALKKCEIKKTAIWPKIFWYIVFVHWKSKLLNFLVDFVLILNKSSVQYRKWSPTANDPQNGPQMILDRKWSLKSTANDPVKTWGMEWNGFYGTDYRKGLIIKKEPFALAF